MSEYDFFLNPETSNQPKRNFGPNNRGTGSSILKRAMVALGGLFLMIILLWFVFNVALKPDTGPADRLANISILQTDIISIATTSNGKLKDNESKELATGAKALLSSDKTKIDNLLKDTGREISKNELIAGTDQTIRTNLATAESANKYDSTFRELYAAKLLVYREALADAYAGTSNENQKQVYNESYGNVSILLGLDVTQTQ